MRGEPTNRGAVSVAGTGMDGGAPRDPEHVAVARAPFQKGRRRFPSAAGERYTFRERDDVVSADITNILREWEYDSNNLIRIIKADDGRDVLQVRQPLGVEQYELQGRPDGAAPEGRESFVILYQERLREHIAARGSDQGFSLSREDFGRLQNEGVIYYFRYLVLFQIGDFERAASDTDHNLALCDLVDRYADKDSDKKEILQYRPYILRINAISRAMISLNHQLKSAAVDIIESAIDAIKKMPNIDTPAFQFEKIRSINSLKATLKQVQEQRVSPVDALRADLEVAVESEDYEAAAEIRDRIRALEGGQAPGGARDDTG